MEGWNILTDLAEIVDAPTERFIHRIKAAHQIQKESHVTADVYGETETTDTIHEASETEQIHETLETKSTDKINEEPGSETTDQMNEESQKETSDQMNEEPEKETSDKSLEYSETNTPVVNTTAREEHTQPETEPQTSHGPPQLRNPHHPLSPHTSVSVAQTVVVTPLSRGPGFQPVSPLPADGSDRAALSQRLAQLEREAKRLKRILGIRETVMEVAMVTDGESSDAITAEERPACADSGSREQNVERRTSVSNLECQVR